MGKKKRSVSRKHFNKPTNKKSGKFGKSNKSKKISKDNNNKKSFKGGSKGGSKFGFSKGRPQKGDKQKQGPPQQEEGGGKRDRFSTQVKRKDKKAKLRKMLHKSVLHLNPSSIKFGRQKWQKNRLKRQERKEKQAERKKVGAVAPKPITIEDKRVQNEDYITQESKEIIGDEAIDEFSTYFKYETKPKILLTTQVKPSKYLYEFMTEIKSVFPNSFYYPRKNYSLKEIASFAPNRDFTDIMVFSEHLKKPHQLILIHLPEGPTTVFRITSDQLKSKIWHHGNATVHDPEIILNNFNTKLGRRIARQFACLFPQNPEFKGRQVVTFQNQRDFLFVRRHRYIFENGLQTVRMQEIGPRFTLKLQQIQAGIFDKEFGQIEWEAKDNMYVKRNKFYL